MLLKYTIDTQLIRRERATLYERERAIRTLKMLVISKRRETVSFFSCPEFVQIRRKYSRLSSDTWQIKKMDSIQFII